MRKEYSQFNFRSVTATTHLSSSEIRKCSRRSHGRMNDERLTRLTLDAQQRNEEIRMKFVCRHRFVSFLWISMSNSWPNLFQSDCGSHLSFYTFSLPIVLPGFWRQMSERPKHLVELLSVQTHSLTQTWRTMSDPWVGQCSRLWNCINVWRGQTSKWVVHTQTSHIEALYFRFKLWQFVCMTARIGFDWRYSSLRLYWFGSYWILLSDAFVQQQNHTKRRR